MSCTLRARGGSTAASRTVQYCRPFSDRGVQLSTTDIFCRKMENTLLLSTVFRVYPKSRILDFSDVVLNSTTFSIFSAKIPVVLNCTHRQKRAYAKLPWNHLEHEESSATVDPTDGLHAITRSEKTSANNLYCYVLIKICSTLKYLSAVGSCPASALLH